MAAVKATRIDTTEKEPMMSVRKDKRKGWMVDIVHICSSGKQVRIRKRSPWNSQRGAEKYERQLRRDLDDPTTEKEVTAKTGKRKVPTFSDWFEGRFWQEWVVANKNKPSEVESKLSIYENYLKDRFGKMPLDKIIRDGRIAQFRAYLVGLSISEKTINNILAVLSKTLRYAEDERIIEGVPKMGFFKVERPEIVWWNYDEYSRILAAARKQEDKEGIAWCVAVNLAGEAGLRIGEIRALVWERDLDLIAGTLTVQRQLRKGKEGTPKGRTRRVIPMTPNLLASLKKLSVVRRGNVVRNADGKPVRDGQTTHAIYRICRTAGLTERAWHCLRHTLGTHAAMFGVNPWKLMAWMGHKSITETLRYVHVAESHMRPIPEEVLEAAAGESDPDRRIIRMLGARGGNHGTLYGTKENAGR